MLDRDGNVYTENLRSATQRVRYILVGDRGTVELEPHFSFQGFRYVAVDGFPGEMSLDSLTGVVIHSDMKPTGELELSDPMLNQLQKNIVWGQKGNFLDVPTDCPQRDERMGWTGDAQVFARTAAFNMDVAAFFTRWLADLEADQYKNGAIPWVIPDVLSSGDRGAGATGWADAGVIIPWTLYLAYGDTRVLEAQYQSMVAWIVARVRSLTRCSSPSVSVRSSAPRSSSSAVFRRSLPMTRPIPLRGRSESTPMSANVPRTPSRASATMLSSGWRISRTPRTSPTFQSDFGVSGWVLWQSTQAARMRSAVA